MFYAIKADMQHVLTESQVAKVSVMSSLLRDSVIYNEELLDLLVCAGSSFIMSVL